MLLTEASAGPRTARRCWTRARPREGRPVGRVSAAVIRPDLPSFSKTQGGSAAHAGTTIIFLARRDHCVPLSVGRTRLVGQLHLDSPCSKKRRQHLQGVTGPSPLSFLSQVGDAPGQGGLQPGRRPLGPEASLPEPHSVLFYFISTKASLLYHVT